MAGPSAPAARAPRVARGLLVWGAWAAGHYAHGGPAGVNTTASRPILQLMLWCVCVCADVCMHACLNACMHACMFQAESRSRSMFICTWIDTYEPRWYGRAYAYGRVCADERSQTYQRVSPGPVHVYECRSSHWRRACLHIQRSTYAQHMCVSICAHARVGPGHM